jgi:hypothetical protein
LPELLIVVVEASPVLAEFLQTMLVDIFNSVEQGVLATFFSASICQLVALLISSPGPRPRHCWLESSSSQPADELLRDALLGTAQASALKQRPDGPKQPRDITYTLLAHLVTLLPSFRHSTGTLALTLHKVIIVWFASCADEKASR